MTKPWETVAQLSLELGSARRPEALSMKKEAKEALNRMWNGGPTHDDWKLLSKVLESLPD